MQKQKWKRKIQVGGKGNGRIAGRWASCGIYNQDYLSDRLLAATSPAQDGIVREKLFASAKPWHKETTTRGGLAASAVWRPQDRPRGVCIPLAISTCPWAAIWGLSLKRCTVVKNLKNSQKNNAGCRQPRSLSSDRCMRHAQTAGGGHMRRFGVVSDEPAP